MSKEIEIASIYGQIKAARKALPDTGAMSFIPKDLIARIEACDEELRRIGAALADKAGL